ncbi:MAG: ATP-binding protein [Acidimicrobiales bacterium]
MLGIRGWSGQRFDLRFPIMAVVGENGSGKSTVLQCAAAVYRPETGSGKKERYASDFFPDTPWDQVRKAEIRYSLREGQTPIISSVRKPGDRWRGNPERRKREVVYIDLSRLQPVRYRVGYSKLAKSNLSEISAPQDITAIGATKRCSLCLDRSLRPFYYVQLLVPAIVAPWSQAPRCGPRRARSRRRSRSSRRSSAGSCG